MASDFHGKCTCTGAAQPIASARQADPRVLDMAGGDAEVTLTGGERSGTRWANSTITTNLIQYDRNLSLTVRLGQRVGTASTRDFSDDGLRTLVAEAPASRFDASDLMPREVGSGSFWTEGTSAVNGDISAAEAAERIQASWPN